VTTGHIAGAERSIGVAQPRSQRAALRALWVNLPLRKAKPIYGSDVSSPLHVSALLLVWFACSHGQRHSADAQSLDPQTTPVANSTLSTPSPVRDSAKASDAELTAGGGDAKRGDDSKRGGESKRGGAEPPARGNESKPHGAGSGDTAAAPTQWSTSDASPVPKLLDGAGKPLPQTEDVPSFDSPSFRRRVQLLFEAIVKDEPAIAAPAFFPVVAYEQVKAIAQPARDHKQRLLTAFAKNIHDYHRQLGKFAANAQLVAVVPSTLAPRWMKPGSEGNRLGYHRLLRSKLKLLDSTGSERLLEITSMISWRGEWYVVHLNGFK
jgi:hypothetical protein